MKSGPAGHVALEDPIADWVQSEFAKYQSLPLPENRPSRILQNPVSKLEQYRPSSLRSPNSAPLNAIPSVKALYSQKSDSRLIPQLPINTALCSI